MKTSLGIFVEGGQGSGNFGHAGRPGEVGGSAGGGTTYGNAVRAGARTDALRDSGAYNKMKERKFRTLVGARRGIAAGVFLGSVETFGKKYGKGAKFRMQKGAAKITGRLPKNPSLKFVTAHTGAETTAVVSRKGKSSVVKLLPRGWQ